MEARMKLPHAVFVSGKGLALRLGDLRKMGIIPSVRDTLQFPFERERTEDYWPLDWLDIEATAIVNECEYLGLTGDGFAHLITPLTPNAKRTGRAP